MEIETALPKASQLKYNSDVIDVDVAGSKGKPVVLVTIKEPYLSAYPLLMEAQKVFTEIERMHREKTGGLNKILELYAKIEALNDAEGGG